MIKYFCDKCGKESESSELLVNYLRVGSYTVGGKKVMLCSECQKQLDEFLGVDYHE